MTKRRLSAPEIAPSGKRRKVIRIGVIVGICVLLAVGVSIPVARSRGAFSADRRTVATCAGYDIPYEELRFVTIVCKDALAKRYGEGIWDDPASAEARKGELEAMVLERLSENYLILEGCKRLEVPTKGKDKDRYVEAEADRFADSFETREAYLAWLRERGMTERYFRFSVGITYLESALYRAAKEKGLFPYSQNNMEDFLHYVESSGDYVRTIHVYIRNEEGEDPAANEARAQGMADTLRAAANAEERLRLMSGYIGSADNDDLQDVSGHGYCFTRGEMEEAYEEAAFGLAIGEVGGPVSCSGGYFVLMRLPPDRELIRREAQKLLDNYHGVMFSRYKEQLRPDCQAALTKRGKRVDLVAMKP